MSDSAPQQLATSQPAVSVIIPVHEAASHLTECLAALQQNNGIDYECIVVDDGSRADIRAVVEQFETRYLRLERQSGPAAARNRGAAVARGDILVFLDADVRAHSDTIDRLVRHLRERPSCTGVFGSYDDGPHDPHFVSQFKNLFHHYVHHSSRAQASTFWTGCSAMRRGAFVAAGGFDESFWSIEDIELGARLCAAGHRIDLNPTIQVTHLKRWTLANLIYTDIFQRAVPWLLLMLRQGTAPADLNLRIRHRISVALAVILPLLAALSIGAAPGLRRIALAGALTASVALLLLNLDLYRFMARKRGVAFAAGAVPLHWLYYGYCALAMAIALPIHWWRRSDAGCRPAGR